MNTGIVFSMLAAIAFGVWTVFHSLAAKHINQLFGAIIISLTAVILGSLFLLPNIKNVTLFTNSKGLLFAVGAGVMALVIDFTVLKAYNSGLPISVAGPIIIGGSIAVAATIGFFLGEQVSAMKIIALLLVIVGASLLAATTS